MTNKSLAAARDLNVHETEWYDQWTLMSDSEYQTESLFWEWVYPLKPEDFKGKRILDAGCGGGHMLSYIEPHVISAVGIDFNTSSIASRRFLNSKKVRVLPGDICSWQQEDSFDIVYSIGVIHHSENPEKAVKNLLKRVKPNGYFSFWVYGYEGNFFVRTFIERPKRLLFSWIPRKALWILSKAITLFSYIFVYSIYSLPAKSLPYYQYFQNWKRLSFERNVANVFDKLNAPRTFFIRKEEIERWFSQEAVQELTIRPWCDISWRVLVKK